MASKPLRLIVCGAGGRMGARVAAMAAADARFKLAAAVSARGEVSCYGAAAVEAEKIGASLESADIVVDFTVPEASVKFAARCAAAKVPIVIGTTGFSQLQLAQLQSAAKKVPVFLSPNFSPAVNLLYRLAAEAARALKGYELSILETHHSAKRDAPSGTALRLGQAVSAERAGAEVPTVSQRVGDIVGEHTLTIAGPFERLELTHRAHSRDLFARGALDAAAWVSRKKAGFFGMDELLSL